MFLNDATDSFFLHARQTHILPVSSFPLLQSHLFWFWNRGLEVAKGAKIKVSLRKRNARLSLSLSLSALVRASPRPLWKLSFFLPTTSRVVVFRVSLTFSLASKVVRDSLIETRQEQKRKTKQKPCRKTLRGHSGQHASILMLPTLVLSTSWHCITHVQSCECVF